MDLKELVTEHLERARIRTLALLEPFDDAALLRQVSPLMSPLVWDLAHIGHFEELWLLRALTGTGPIDARHDDLYDAFRHPRRERSELALLGPAAARRFVSEVRGRALDVLERTELTGDDPLRRDAFVYGMVVQHEHQHCETMLATIQLMECAYDVALDRPGAPAPAPALTPAPAAIALPGGAFVMGTDREPWGYDNERPAHVVDVAPFAIDTVPVTNAAYREFVDTGGYDEPRHWSDEGWKWRQQAELAHPQYWRREGSGSWSVLRFGRRLALCDDEPVQHVCWHEADAFARWSGARLPTEVEWEYAASWGPDGVKRRHPWGDSDPTPELANLGQLRLGPTPATTRGASAWGALAMVGDVWEWTASDFRPYPGFRSFPYREYSEVFFGPEHKVLRGGSWAAAPVAVRATFRNWDYPIRRQVFTGFRCAHDA